MFLFPPVSPSCHWRLVQCLPPSCKLPVLIGFYLNSNSMDSLIHFPPPALPSFLLSFSFLAPFFHVFKKSVLCFNSSLRPKQWVKQTWLLLCESSSHERNTQECIYLRSSFTSPLEARNPSHAARGGSEECLLNWRRPCKWINVCVHDWCVCVCLLNPSSDFQ